MKSIGSCFDLDQPVCSLRQAEAATDPRAVPGALIDEGRREVPADAAAEPKPTDGHTAGLPGKVVTEVGTPAENGVGRSDGFVRHQR